MVAKINDLVDKKFFNSEDYFHIKQQTGLDKKARVSDLSKASVKVFNNTASGFVSSNMQNAVEELSVLEIVSDDAYYQAEVTESKTVGPSGDFSSIYDALTYFANRLSTSSLDPRPLRQAQQSPYYLITLLSGWVIASGERVFKNVDLSHIRIEGVSSSQSNVIWTFINSKTPVMSARVASTVFVVGPTAEIRTLLPATNLPSSSPAINLSTGSKMTLMDSRYSSGGYYTGSGVSARDCSKIIGDTILGSTSPYSTVQVNLSYMSEAYLHFNPSVDVRQLSKVFFSGLKVLTGNFFARGLSEIFVNPDASNTNIVGEHVFADHGSRIRVPNHARTGNGVVRSTFGSEVVLDSTLNQIRVIYNTQINNASKFRGEWKTASTTIAVLVASRASLVTLDVNTNNFVPNIAVNTFTSSGLYIKETS